MKTIYIFLTRSSTFVSRLVHFLTSDPYTHASIAFDSSMQPLYSSSRKNGRTMFPAGPCYEWFNRGLYKMYPKTPCAVYALEVSEEVYSNALAEAERLVASSEDYRFNQIGMILCYMKIPSRSKRRFFCSQFVSEILTRSHAMKLPKDPSLMRPIDYSHIPGLPCVYKGCIGELAKNGIRTPLTVNVSASSST